MQEAYKNADIVTATVKELEKQEVKNKQQQPTIKNAKKIIFSWILIL
jgi:ketol-acid reductoisomerase